ncbi:MAG: hypothetical protein V4525_07930 [Pseudomonadota bacterium]
MTTFYMYLQPTPEAHLGSYGSNGTRLRLRRYPKRIPPSAWLEGTPWITSAWTATLPNSSDY